MGRATDYSNCYIYHIVDKEGIVHYVGSTSNLNSRKSKHKYCCRTENCKHYHLDIYQYIRDNGGFDAFEIVPISKIENISNKTELLIAERSEMEKHSGLKNMIGSYLTEEERAIQHAKNCKKWIKQNPEKNAEHQRQWRQNHPEKKRENNRKYREANREKINEYSRKWYAKKKELKNTDQ